jgi:hypothetical protein
MELSLMPTEAKLTIEKLETSAKVTLEQVDGGYAGCPKGSELKNGKCEKKRSFLGNLLGKSMSESV